MDNWTRRVLIFLALCVLVDSTDWKQLAQEELDKALNRKPNTNKALNVILFIGDGMGVSTVTAARILRGQTQGKPGEETVLEFEKFPNVGLSKTYANDKQTTGSASTATAMMCGEKTNYRIVGLNDRAIAKNCSSTFGNEMPCAFQWFREDGRSVGVVTTARITHATPASAYAKSPERDWEVDTAMVGVTGGCTDIASQLVYNNSFAKVMMGGGRRFFLPMNDTDPESSRDVDGKNAKWQRLDGIDLTQVWKEKHQGDNAEYVWNKSQFDAIDASKTDYILGLFEAGHMQHESERDKGTNGEPSLAEMTKKAIQVLQKDKNGFFLMVEDGRIDSAHHDNNAKRALYSVLAFEDAVKVATEMTDESDTLIIVTADHSHVFSIAGYQKRGNDILGVIDVGEKSVAKDGIPFTTLLYGNGVSYDWGNRTNVSAVDTTDNDYLQVAAAPRSSETHGGEDVSIYARGPMSHLIHGVHEQHYIAHVMTYAACVANNKHRCDNIQSYENTGAVCSTHSVLKLFVTYFLVKLIFI
ncbi:alkaline phosphatase-like [Mizuhopecten yessoensis]|uniref:Alkaline phosphatase, tissue-nonspecific isozyme n=1 Tax=Mizuhopecten yessoensis TaxID=6573 RepID=A0A210Q2M0_MIZYE|nr:alkaline phosphatase-like [Mizuhopecten yessoensis]OWF42955.1 Alkaline phosphatase, tissue-nonspecific isozyme [Mizuhopecten yessoensis]